MNDIKCRNIISKVKELMQKEEYVDALKISSRIKWGELSGEVEIELMYLNAQCYFYTEDYVHAIEYIEYILNLNNEHAQAKILLGRLCLVQGMVDDAIKVWKQLLNDKNVNITNQQREELKELIKIKESDNEADGMNDEIEKVSHLEVLYILESEGAKSYLALKKNFENFTIRRIRHKKKVSLAFVLYDSSMWCGDELYHYFANDERYDTVVYLCKRHDGGMNASAVIREFYSQVDEMKNRGINVVPIFEEVDSARFVQPDVLITLTPYDKALPHELNFGLMNSTTLLVYIPYGFFIWDSKDDGERTYNIPITNMAWKMFIDTEENRKYYEEHLSTRFVNGEASGSPRCDYFYQDNSNNNFIWKETVTNAKRIVYAPHWSIDDGCKFATFHYNYDFFYELIKTRLDLSFVIKPHPNLIYSAVKSGVFEDEKEAVRYFRRFDELPNARVVTGGDYYKIFSSSDAMILDSASFLAEYQYTGKPLLFLTRAEQNLLPLGKKILKCNYSVDGHDWYGILDFIDNVVVQGNDKKDKTRRSYFSKDLDYKTRNGVLASEYIYQSISKELAYED